jgi:hypothetical protein
MNGRMGWVAGAAAVLVAGTIGLGTAGGEEGHDDAKLLGALGKSKHTLVDAIRQASAKAPETAMSAKFELGDDGKLSLSVYTAEKGTAVGAEANVLKELAGSPEADAWKPEAEVFKDVPHVARSSEQLTLMALTSHALAEIAEKAAKDQPGTVFSIAPVVRGGKGWFAVLVAAKDKVVEVEYDLITGAKK